MCSYNITINDSIIEKVRPSFANETDFEQWLQQQIEQLLIQFYSSRKARARLAIELMRQQSEMNGNSKLTLDEINEEIRQARKEKKNAVAQ
ncbi:MAG: hypothetical protein IKT08_06510 [Bacteroidales bacterium]|nr:hypothetical protein [Bacteroidales bacterium]